MYLVFQLRTTGFSPVCNHKIEIAIVLLINAGGDIEGSEFESLINPPCLIPWKKVELTNISHEDMVNEETIHQIGFNINTHVLEQVWLHKSKHSTQIKHIVFVAHNDVGLIFNFCSSSLTC
jgi:DNA polymerase III alpha subunit (gram-positive type)